MWGECFEKIREGIRNFWSIICSNLDEIAGAIYEYIFLVNFQIIFEEFSEGHPDEISNQYLEKLLNESLEEFLK